MIFSKTLIVQLSRLYLIKSVLLINKEMLFYTHYQMGVVILNHFGGVLRKCKGMIFFLITRLCISQINIECVCVFRCFFSEDGRHLLVILSVNSFQIYTINDDGTNLAVQIKASVMAHLLQPFKMGKLSVNKTKIYGTYSD